MSDLELVFHRRELVHEFQYFRLPSQFHRLHYHFQDQWATDDENELGSGFSLDRLRMPGSASIKDYFKQ